MYDKTNFIVGYINLYMNSLNRNMINLVLF